jgi:hypothetical protein
MAADRVDRPAQTDGGDHSELAFAFTRQRIAGYQISHAPAATFAHGCGTVSPAAAALASGDGGHCS